ncbi:MAG TPA: ACT domain-containing protein [Gammaproteobacteria bacterium]|nr:ACT domain-containing protein [Gammaproteobacteria bacterium]
MNETNTLLVSVICPDRPGLISSITGLLFDLGINLADTSFSVLGSGAEFTAICEAPHKISADVLVQQLRELDNMANADIKVSSFKWGADRGEAGRITHRITLQGDDQPGLVARLTEVVSDYDANIVRMDTKTISTPTGREYLIEMGVSVLKGRAEACLAAIGNTAASLNMKNSWTEIKK